MKGKVPTAGNNPWPNVNIILQLPLIGPFDLNAADMFFSLRGYMEPATNVGPDDNERLYGLAIYFGPCFDKQ